MMNKIELQQVPNQSLSCQLGGKLFIIDVQLGRSGSTLLTVTVDGESIISGRLAAAQAQMIPAPTNSRIGNMGWLCEDGASYPEYSKFGTLHNLYWWD